MDVVGVGQSFIYGNTSMFGNGSSGMSQRGHRDLPFRENANVNRRTFGATPNELNGALICSWPSIV